MVQTTNLGLPIGDPVADWTPPPIPPREPMIGQTCRLEPLDVAKHVADLFTAISEDTEGRMWTYMGEGPFETEGDYRIWLNNAAAKSDQIYFTIVDVLTGKALGLASYLRIAPQSGSIEVGSIAYSPALQRTKMATEAMYLMMANVFALGYRRYEWKCNSLNAGSRAAAERLGFTFEGIFRQAIVVKGRNRDTAWYAIIDQDWPKLQPAFEAWLSDDNFEDDGRQKTSLSTLTREALAAR